MVEAGGAIDSPEFPDFKNLGEIPPTVINDKVRNFVPPERDHFNTIASGA